MEIVVRIRKVHICYLDKCIDVWQSNISADCMCTVNCYNRDRYCHIKVSFLKCINN